VVGNVWEWVLDYQNDPYAIASCSDCAYLTPPTPPPVRRVFLGGAFGLPESSLRSQARAFGVPEFRNGAIGARCARPVN
jgi:formylglycine-generating enzyme required for sulfatase activity